LRSYQTNAATKAIIAVISNTGTISQLAIDTVRRSECGEARVAELPIPFRFIKEAERAIFRHE
jgi:hypothetical protein